MKGIIVADLDSLIKNTNLKVEDIREDVQDLRTSFLELRRSIHSTELAFLTEKFYKETTQFNILFKKMNCYQASLKSVLMGYQYQEQQIASDISRVTP
jgi:hypothetical protein